MKNDTIINIVGILVAIAFLLIGILVPLRELFSMGTIYGIMALIIMPGIPLGINIHDWFIR